MNSEVNKTKILEKRVGAAVKKSAPLVSIVVPAYDVARFAAEMLDSILAQTFTDYEAILVNDGSHDTPELEKVLAPYFEHIVYVKQENGGASAARNTAIENARGSILAFLDGDDVWLPEYLESQVNFLQANRYEMVYCDALLFGESVNSPETFMQNAPSRGRVTPESLLKTECNVITSGTILLKRTLDRYGLFDLESRRAQDFDMWFRLAKNNVNIGYQTKVLLKYRVRLTGLTGGNLERARRDVIAFETIRRNNRLNEQEMRVWNRQMKIFAAAVCLEKSKVFLVSGAFAEARRSLRQAIEHAPTRKLKVISLLLTVNPKMVRALFKKLRLPEFSAVAAETVESRATDDFETTR